VSQVVLVVALGVSLLTAAWLYAYKLRHPYTTADLVKARRESIDKSRSVVSGKVQAGRTRSRATVATDR
jgi:hypothetical protein